MKAPGAIEGLEPAPNCQSYTQVISGIQNNPASTISVPELSRLLGVKATTLNARFRRQQARLKTVGRTNFIPVDLALNLASMHKYALLGWPTLQQAARLTGVKTGTIKARCEKGRLEGHMDLTKRLRINPAELTTLELLAPAAPRSDRKTPAQRQVTRREPMRPSKRDNSKRLTGSCARESLRNSQPYVLAPAPEPEISVLTARDYGLTETDEQLEVPVAVRENGRRKQKFAALLSYNPDRPFSISECKVGQLIRYGHYDGTILKVINDPFSPKILASFPDHQHPLMREVLLLVEKSRI